MNDETEYAIDALLREQFEGPVADHGFCESVMDRLPARRRWDQWPMVTGIFAGVAACWFSLWSAPIAFDGWHDWLSRAPSAATLALFIVMTSMAVLALVWTIAEADDQYRPSRRVR